MPSWALTFLIIAGVSGLLGFSGAASIAAGLAEIHFFIFAALFIFTLVFGSRHHAD